MLAGGDEDREVQQVRVTKRAWRRATFSLTVLSLVLFAALIAQTSIEPGPDTGKADPLATLALVLAILAFLVQIVTYAIQARNTHEALRRGDEVNAGTKNILTQIRTTADQTQKTQTAQLDRLIDYFLERDVPAAVDRPDVIDPEPAEHDDGAGEIDEELLSRKDATELVEDAIARYELGRRRASADAARSAIHKDRPSPEDREIIDYMKSFPDREEAARSVEILNRLPRVAVMKLAMLAERELALLGRGQRSRSFFRADSPVRVALESEGLIRSTRIPDRGTASYVVHLTDRGREVARLVTMKHFEHPYPDWWDEAMAAL